MPLAIGVIAAVLLLAWGGVEVNHVVHAYPVQFWLSAACVLIVAFALAAARFRISNERVPLRPAPRALPPAVRVVPELKAAPVLRAIASTEAPDAQDCEGPGCPHKVDDDPWTWKAPGEEESHVFCSEACGHSWHDARRPGVPR